MSRNRNVIRTGKNSGHQAINLAYHWGARRLVLLGFDCRRIEGKRHWFGDHPAPLRNECTDQQFQGWIECFGVMAQDLQAEGIEVVNCSLHSAIPFWPKVPVEEALR